MFIHISRKQPSTSAPPNQPAFDNKSYTSTTDMYHDTVTPSAPPLPSGGDDKNQMMPQQPPCDSDAAVYLEILPQGGLATQADNNIYTALRSEDNIYTELGNLSPECDYETIQTDTVAV